MLYNYHCDLIPKHPHHPRTFPRMPDPLAVIPTFPRHDLLFSKFSEYQKPLLLKILISKLRFFLAKMSSCRTSRSSEAKFSRT